VVLFATAAVAFAGFVPYELRRGVVAALGAIVGFSFGPDPAKQAQPFPASGALSDPSTPQPHDI
jgi:hypothetical protein